MEKRSIGAEVAGSNPSYEANVIFRNDYYPIVKNQVEIASKNKRDKRQNQLKLQIRFLIQ